MDIYFWGASIHNAHLVLNIIYGLPNLHDRDECTRQKQSLITVRMGSALSTAQTLLSKKGRDDEMWIVNSDCGLVFCLFWWATRFLEKYVWVYVDIVVYIVLCWCVVDIYKFRNIIVL